MKSHDDHEWMHQGAPTTVSVVALISIKQILRNGTVAYTEIG